jgi:small conductance mechanosensitive channel
MSAPQLEALSQGQQTGSQPADTTAAADTTAGLDQISELVDRITEIRSWSDLWELIGQFQVGLLAFVGNLFKGFIVLVLFLAIYLIIRTALRRVFQRSRVEEDAAELLLTTLKFVVLGLAIIVALDQVGFNMTGLLAGLGVAGLALGFAAKDTLANFIAGITILMDRPFRVGDRVEIDDEFGQVKKITLRSTRIHTNQNKVVIIPNQNVANNTIINHTMQASLRLDIPFGIAYDEDIREARDVVLAQTEGDERLRERPGPEVVVTELADSAVVLALRIWLKNPHQEIPLGFEYREKIKRSLDDAGIVIPFPHLSLFVEKLPEPAPSTSPTGESGAEDPR